MFFSSFTKKSIFLLSIHSLFSLSILLLLRKKNIFLLQIFPLFFLRFSSHLPSKYFLYKVFSAFFLSILFLVQKTKNIISLDHNQESISGPDLAVWSYQVHLRWSNDGKIFFPQVEAIDADVLVGEVLIG